MLELEAAGVIEVVDASEFADDEAGRHRRII
jgi:hypothetical protein